jgi:hypothetical protein
VACCYRFGADQLMFIRGKAPKARYFSLCLYNVWMESLDYRTHRISLNHEQLEMDAQGNFEVCLAHANPGHPNWLDTAGHHAGYVLLRALLPEQAIVPPTVEVKYVREWSPN